MSAYIVDRNHILYLVEAGGAVKITWQMPACDTHSLGYGEIQRGACDAARIANILWQENIRSVCYRYPDVTEATAPGPIGEEFTVDTEEFTRPHWHHFDAVQVIKAAKCYAYQSCEHETWEDSEANEYIRALIHWHIDRLAYYDDAIWGAPPTVAKLEIMRLDHHRAKAAGG